MRDAELGRPWYSRRTNVHIRKPVGKLPPYMRHTEK